MGVSCRMPNYLRPTWFMTARRWIAAALAILFTAALGIALLKHKARSSTKRQGQTTAYSPWKKRKLEFNKQIAPIIYSNCEIGRASCRERVEIVVMTETGEAKEG